MKDVSKKVWALKELFAEDKNLVVSKTAYLWLGVRYKIPNNVQALGM